MALSPEFLSGISESPFQRSFENDRRLLQEKQANLAIEGQKLQLDQARKQIDDREGFQRDLKEFLSEGGDDRAQLQQLRIRYPEQVQAIDSIMKAQGPDFQQAQFRKNSETFSLLDSGREDLVKQRLEADLKAAQNTEDPVMVGAAQRELDLFQQSPQAYKKNVMLRLDSLSGGKFSEGEERFAKTEKFSKEVGKVGAETEKIIASIPTEKLQQESTKLNNQIKAMEVDYRKSTDPLKRKKLEQDLKTKSLEAQEKKIALEQSKLSAKEKERAARRALEENIAANALKLETVNRVLDNPALDDVVGSKEGDPDSWLSSTGLDDDESQAVADIESLTSQQFVDNLIRIKQQGGKFGALTDKEGDRLINYLVNLKRTQTEEQFRAQLNTIKTLLEKAQVRDVEELTRKDKEIAAKRQEVLKEYGVE